RGEKFQDGNSFSGERACGQAVFQVERADHPGLFEDRQAKHGSGTVVAQVKVIWIEVLGKRVIEDQPLVRSQDVLQRRLREVRRSNPNLPQRDFHAALAGRRFRFDVWLVFMQQDQQAAARASMLDSEVDEFLE